MDGGCRRSGSRPVCVLSFDGLSHGHFLTGITLCLGFFVGFAVLLEGLLLRYVYSDKVSKGILQVVGRRSTLLVALRPEDCVDIKHTIWAARKDVKKLN